MSTVSARDAAPSTIGTREAQRLETRARLFDAAVAEISRSGLTGADVSSIVAAAGVARGTFYFHFPTKEHVLAELVRTEEARIVAKLNIQTTDLRLCSRNWSGTCWMQRSVWGPSSSGTCSGRTSPPRGR